MKKQIVLTCPICGKADWLEAVEHEDGFYYPCAHCGAMSLVEQMCSTEVDSELRDDLVFSAGYHAGCMEGCVSGFAMPDGVEGFHDASVFVARCVDAYLDSDRDEPFDCYIEKVLMTKYGNN